MTGANWSPQVAQQSIRAGALDAERVLADAKCAAGLPLGRFNNLGMRGMLLRRLLLKLHLPFGLLERLVRLLRGISGSNWETFAVSLFYWVGVRDRLFAFGSPGREVWQQLVNSPRILMYHAVGKPGEKASTYILPARAFSRQMRWLQFAGYRVIPLAHLLEARRNGRLFPARSVVITFDDGYCDNLELAAPLLQKYHFPATVFLVTGMAGKASHWAPGDLDGRPLISWADAADLRRFGIELGGHGLSHRSLTDLTPAELVEEVAATRASLEQNLENPVLTFAYPNGNYQPSVQAALVDGGFPLACCSDPGPCDPFVALTALPRLEIRGAISFLDFVLALWLGKTHVIRRLREAL